MGKIFRDLEKIINYCKMKYNTKVLFHDAERGKGFISGSVIYKNPENICIGKNSYINGGQLIAEGAKIKIGENCLLSYNVHLRTDVHNYIDKDQLINMQGNTSRDIIIEDDVWIGYGAQIMSGVRVAKGSVIGAGAIVTHDTEQYGVYVGVPAKLIKKRVPISANTR